MNKKYILFVFAVVTSSCTSMLFSYRTRFLNDQQFTSTQENVLSGVCGVAGQLAFQKERKKVYLKKKMQKKALEVRMLKRQRELKKEEVKRQQKLAQAARLKRKNMRREEIIETALLRKAASLEKKRRKKITAWRDYRRTKKAAKLLIKEAYKVDVGNDLHMNELQDEVRLFSNERLSGKIENYPELEGFLEL